MPLTEPWPDKDVATLRKMAAAGSNSYEIAVKVGRKVEPVVNMAKKLGIEIRKVDRAALRRG